MREPHSALDEIGGFLVDDPARPATKPPDTPTRHGHRLAEGLEAWARRWETNGWPLIAGGLPLLAGLTLLRSSNRLFWFDELLTFQLARLPDFRTLWAALTAGIDLQLPLSILATRVAQTLFGQGEVATRLPALAGFLLMTVCLYVFVRRRTNAIYGAAAALFPAVTEAHLYACEARSYGLLLGFGALALLCWQEAASGRHRRLGLAGLALSFTLALSSHYFAVLLYVPLAVGELVRAVQRRKLDIPIALAAALPIATLIAYLPLMQAGRTLYTKTPWSPATARFLYEAFQVVLTPAVAPLVFCVAVLYYAGWWLPRAAAMRRSRLTAPEAGACFGFLLLPLAAYLISRLVHGTLTPRYILPLVIGFSVLFTCLSYDATGGRAIVGLALVAILGGTLLVRTAARGYSSYNPFAAVQLPTEDRNLPVLVERPHYFLSLLHYATPEVQARIAFLPNPDTAKRNMADLQMIAAGPFFHLPLANWDQFSREHRRFYLLTSPEGKWMDQNLRAEGSHLEYVSRYDEGATLYLVTLR
jgi:hypothetical protein